MVFDSFPFVPLIPLLALAGGSIAVLALDLILPEGKGRAWWFSATVISLLAALGHVALNWEAASEVLLAGWTLDGLTRLFVCVAAGAALAAVGLSARRSTRDLAGYLSLVLLAALGMATLIGSANLIILFVGLELLSLSLYVAVALRSKGDGVAAGTFVEDASREAALKYLILGSVASGLLLYGSALLYGAAGTLDFAEMRLALAGADSTLLRAGLMLIVVGLAFKMALAPFHAWAPDAYQGAPIAVAALMSVGTKAAAFAALLRVAAAAAQSGALEVVLQPLWVMAVAGMAVGSLGAIRQMDLKRLLAYSGIAHSGYLMIALSGGGATAEGLTAGAFYVLAYLFMNIGAFAVVAAIGGDEEAGSRLETFRGLMYRRPAIAIVFLLFLLSLAGVPATAGFVGKVLLVLHGVRTGAVFLIAGLVATTAISGYAYLRVVFEVFKREEKDLPAGDAAPGAQEAAAAGGVGISPPVGAVLLLSGLGTLYLGLFPHSTLQLLQRLVMLGM